MGSPGPAPDTTLDDALNVFFGLDDSSTPLTAREVADELDCTRRTAYTKLTALAEQGALNSKKVGARGRVWWRSEGRVRIDRVTDGIYELDAEWRFTYVNERAEEIIQRTEAEVHGERLWEVFPEAAEGIVWEKYHEAMDTQESVSFELFYEPLDVWVAVSAYPSETGLSVYFRDVTERVERDQALAASEARFRALAETATDAIITIDEESEIQYANPAVEDVFGYAPTALIGEPMTTLIPEPNRDGHLAGLDRYVDTGEREFDWAGIELSGRRKDGGAVDLHVSFSDFEVDGDRRFTGIIRDITDRRTQERALEEQRERYRRLLEAAPVAIAVFDADGRVEYANEAAVTLIGADDPAELVGLDALEFVHPDDRSAARAGLRRVIEDRARTPTSELRILSLAGPDDGIRHAMTSSVPITYDGEPAAQTVLADITSQRERERQLAHQREQVAALNQLNGVVQNITHAVIESSSRDEIETLVCERLAGTESYCHAWVGTLDREAGVARERTAAGIDGYLDDVTVSIDGAQHDMSPTGSAVRTGEIHLARELEARPGDRSWRDNAVEHGIRSVMAIPIEYENSLYGVLTVCSVRPNAFDPNERDVIAGLGQVMGHALTAIDRKQALLSEEVIELRLRVGDLLGAFGVPTPDDGHIWIDGVVQTDEGTYLEYGVATGTADETVEALVEQVPQFESVGFMADDATGTRFELTVTEPPAINTIASIGARIESAVIDDGDFDVVIHAPPGSDVRAIVETFRAAYPGTHVVAQRQTIETNRAIERLATVLSDELTDRQRAVLETAFLAGFFESPRNRTGAEIADSLGIASSTFLQHVRASERKLFGALFEDGTGRTEAATRA